MSPTYGISQVYIPLYRIVLAVVFKYKICRIMQLPYIYMHDGIVTNTNNFNLYKRPHGQNIYFGTYVLNNTETIPVVVRLHDNTCVFDEMLFEEYTLLLVEA